MKYLILLSLFLTGCNIVYFSPITWFNSFDNEPETSATKYGDCTTDTQCEELIPGEHFFCYKEKSYVGQCVKVIGIN